MAEAVIEADPKLTPFTWGCAAGVVAPAAMATLAVTVTLDGSELVSAMVTPPAGAGVAKLTGNAADWPNPNATGLAGSVIEPGVTVTLAVASAIFGGALAWITADPPPTPVTGTIALVEFAAKVTDGGTVATPVLLELRLTFRAVGAGAARFSVRFCVAPPRMVTVPGGKLIVSVTRACAVAEPNAGVDAVMFADPTLMPVTCGWAAGVVVPAAMKTLAGFTVALAESLLVRVTVTPPAGAAAGKVTANAADWPSATATLFTRIAGGGTTVTVAAVSGTPGRALAWMTADPPAAPVTGTATWVAFAANVTVAGTVATPGESELRLIVSPPVGAATDRFNVRFCETKPLMVRLPGAN